MPTTLPSTGRDTVLLPHLIGKVVGAGGAIKKRTSQKEKKSARVTYLSWTRLLTFVFDHRKSLVHQPNRRVVRDLVAVQYTTIRCNGLKVGKTASQLLNDLAGTPRHGR